VSRVLSSNFLENPEWALLSEPMLRFTKSANETIQFPIEGIQKYGPYDYNTRKRSFDSIRVVFLYKHGTEREQLIKKINSRMCERFGYYKGLSSEFRLNSVVSEYIGYEDDEQVTALRDLKRHSIENSSTERTIVLVTGDDYKAFSDTEHYWLSKRILLKSGVPCQYLSGYRGSSGVGVLGQNPDSNNFVYTIWNVVLSSYAKVGGVPWILKDTVAKDQSIDAIAGIRFARDQSNVGDSKYVIGAVTVFGSYGLLYGVDAQKFLDTTEGGERYTSRSKGLYVSEKDSKKLAEIIVERYRDNEGESPKHVIIHRLGSYDNNEISGLEEGLKNAGVEKYAFIEIFRGGNPRIFEIRNEKASSVRRGLVLNMSDNSSLICTTGDQRYKFRDDIKQPKHYMGTPVPITANIRVSNNSINDPMIVAKNIFNLTGLHWGCGWSQEIQLPITLDFAHKIARLYANGVIPHDNLRNTSWFL